MCLVVHPTVPVVSNLLLVVVLYYYYYHFIIIIISGTIIINKNDTTHLAAVDMLEREMRQSKHDVRSPGGNFGDGISVGVD